MMNLNFGLGGDDGPASGPGLIPGMMENMMGGAGAAAAGMGGVGGMGGMNTAETAAAGLSGLSEEEIWRAVQSLAHEDPVEAQMMIETLESQRGMMGRDFDIVIPEPGFVVKTADADGKKVFINMCHCDKIGLPRIDDKVVEELPAEVQANAEAVRIPMSLGQPFTDLDKSGQAASIYDAVFNPVVIEKAKDNAEWREFAVNIAFAYVMQKFKAQLNEQVIKFPRMSYKGTTPRSQTIRRQDMPTKIEEVKEKLKSEIKNPLISEVEPKEEAAKETAATETSANSADSQSKMKKGWWAAKSTKAKQEKAERKKAKQEKIQKKKEEAAENATGLVLAPAPELPEGVRVPEYNLEEVQGADGKSVEKLVVRVYLTAVESAGSVDLEITGPGLSLTVPDVYDLNLILPFNCDADSSKAKFDKKKRIMTLTLPLADGASQVRRSSWGLAKRSESKAEEEDIVDSEDEESSDSDDDNGDWGAAKSFVGPTIEKASSERWNPDNDPFVNAENDWSDPFKLRLVNGYIYELE